MIAPCAGTVWFRWLRPSRQHTFVPMVVVFQSPTSTEAWVLAERDFLAGTYKDMIAEFVEPDRPFIAWRRTLDQCSRCGATE